MKPRAVILKTSTFISPFGDHVSQAFFTHETLAETQERAFRRLGIAVDRAESVPEAIEIIERSGARPIVLLLDRVFVSEKALGDFLSAARRAPRPAALALSVNASVEYTLPLQDVRIDAGVVVHDVLIVDRGSLGDDRAAAETDPVHWVHALRDRARPVIVPKREIVIDVPLPTIGERERSRMRYPVTSTIVVSIEHWVHILWLNQIAFGIRWMELVRRHPLWTAYRALTAFSINRHKLLDRLVWKGPRTSIHPTAYLSGSIIGRGVTVGAHVTLRNSIVGDEAVLQDHSVLLNTVVGPKTLVTENSFLVSTVAYPGATIGNYKLQVTLIGRDAYVNAWAGFVDAKFQGDVMVKHGTGLAPSGRAFLGSCVGHRAKVAAKVLIQPGREIPNDTLVVMRPDEVVSVIPEGLPANTPLVRDRGTLVKLGEESS